MLAAVPSELQERPQWVVWRYESRDGRETKVPYRADGRGRASTTDRSSWSTFEDAAAAAADASGVGFVFSEDDPYVGVDLDGGLKRSDWGAIIVALDSYSETSVSGEGAHVIVRASLNGHSRRRAGPVEVYEQGRFFVVTGEHIRSTPVTIEPRQTELELVLAEFLPETHAAAAAVPAVPVDVDDRELLERALAARNGSALADLWQGRWQGRYTSQSEADLALCGMLAFLDRPRPRTHRQHVPHVRNDA